MSTAPHPPITIPTPTEALGLAAAWSARRKRLQELEAEQKLDEARLLAYFETTAERTVGAVTCWSRKSTSTALTPTVKRFDRETTIAQLLEDATFTAFVGERVMGDEVLRQAHDHKGLRTQLEKCELITRHLDETALAKAAVENAALATALKSYKLQAQVVETHKYYLKA